jgi:ATP-dependent Clp protease ATP-binding subunit ClpC
VYERFTDRAYNVMKLAQREARGLQHQYVGTGHVLLGLVGEGAGVGGYVLKTLGVGLDELRAECGKIIQPAPHVSEQHPDGPLPFAPSTTRMLEHAAEEAKGLDHNYVGTEHLLLGCLREEGGTGYTALKNLGVSVEAARRAVIEILNPDNTNYPDIMAEFKRLLGKVTVENLAEVLNRMRELVKDVNV